MASTYESLLNMFGMGGAQAAPGPSAPDDVWGLPPRLLATAPPMAPQPQMPQPMPKMAMAPQRQPQSNPGIPGAITTASGMLASPDESHYRELADKLKNDGAKYLEQQAGGIQSQEEMLKAALGQKAQLDLSPLLSLADAWSGSRMAQSYQRPEDIAARAGQLSAGIQKGRNDLAQNEVALLKAGLGSEADLLSAQGRHQDRMLQAKISKDQKDILTGQKADEKIERDIQELQSRHGDSVPGMITKFQGIDDLLVKMPTDISGAGSEKWKPDFLLDKNGQSLRQLSTGLLDDVVKLYSGSAASEGEVRRKVQAMGGTMFQTSDQYRDGMKFLKEMVRKKLSSTEAAFKPEVAARYKSRGGIASSDLNNLTFGIKQKVQVGTVDGNHRFKGGDPSNAENWEVLQ